MRTDEWKVIAVDDFSEPDEVYNLIDDPLETNNLVNMGAPLPDGIEKLLPLLAPRKGE